MKLTVFVILMMLLSMPKMVIAAEYFAFIYTTKVGDDFAKILKKFVRPDSIINRKTPMVDKIIRRNPHVTNWKSLKPNTKIMLYVPKNFIVLAKYKEYENANLYRLLIALRKRKEDFYPVGFKWSMFYMASLGNFKQKDQNVSVDFNQNAPFTLGSTLSYYPKNKMYSMSVSGYYSYLLPAANSIDNAKTTTPPEIGTNAYIEYRFKDLGISGYTGLDYELFTTFNTPGIYNNNLIYLDRNSVLYLTLGGYKVFSFMQHPLVVKLSFSKTLLTKTNPGYIDIANPTPSSLSYTGYKFLFYLNYKFSEKFFIHSLVKYHTLSGSSDLSSVRIGIGLGYSFW